MGQKLAVKVTVLQEEYSCGLKFQYACLKEIIFIHNYKPYTLYISISVYDTLLT